MPLELLLPLVVFGIGGIVLVIHLLGYSTPCPLPDNDTVKRHWNRHFPDDLVQSVTIDDDGHTALVRTDAGDGLLWSFGADTVARRLEAVDITETPEGFHIDFHDFTAPSHLVRLAPHHHADWRSRLTGHAV